MSNAPCPIASQPRMLNNMRGLRFTEVWIDEPRTMEPIAIANIQRAIDRLQQESARAYGLPALLTNTISVTDLER